MQSRHFFLTILFFLSCLRFGFAQQSTVLNHGGTVLTVKFSPVDNNLVASAGDNNTIKLWDLQNGTMRPFRGHTATINSIAFSPDGNLLASGSADRTVKLWDVHTQQNIATLEHITDGEIRTVTFPPDGQRLAIGEIQAVTFSPDGQRLAIADGGHDVILWNIDTQREIATLPNVNFVRSLAFSPNGQFLAASGQVWNLAGRKVIAELADGNQAVFSPDGKLVANCRDDGEVNLWDVRDWTLTAVLPLYYGSHESKFPVDITSDNKTLVTGRYIWSLETGQRLADLGSWAKTVSLSPDGKTLARDSPFKGTVRVENIEAYLQPKLLDRFIVKLYYFLPNDRSPQPDIDATIEQTIKEAQHAFAEQMAHHGFGRKTFTYETDASGKAVVHHIKGQRNAAFYVNNPVASQNFLGWTAPSTSTGPLPYRPDRPENIHIVFVDVRSERWASKCTSYYTNNHDRGGIITSLAQGACVEFHSLTWVLQDAFGLSRDSIRHFSGATERIELSYAAAEWLDAHRYFTANPTHFNFNVPPMIKMLKPRAALTGSLHLSFKITDPDGLHQAQLRIPHPNNEILYLFGQMIGYKSLSGETKNVRFVTTELTRANRWVTLHVMDTYGNVTVRKFSIDTRTIKREPVPVNLSRFRADRTDSGVILNWATESELNNAGFYILRSETKNGQFKVVNPTMIQGAGTTSDRNTYTWTDTTAKPNTLYYYRIEDISHTGARQQLATVRLRGLVSATGKMLTRWADLKK